MKPFQKKISVEIIQMASAPLPKYTFVHVTKDNETDEEDDADLRIYLDDSISIIKQKFATLFENDLPPKDLYLFVKVPVLVSKQALYNTVNELAIQENAESISVLQKVTKNTGLANVSDFLALLALQAADVQYKLVPLGQTYLDNDYVVNPYEFQGDNNTIYPVVAENKSKYLLDYGQILDNKIYYCWRSEVLHYFNEVLINNDVHIVEELYFPEKREFAPKDQVELSSQKNEIYAKYDTTFNEELDLTITELNFSLDLAQQLRLPLDILFKAFLHANVEVPLIKYKTSYRVALQEPQAKAEKLLKKMPDCNMECISFCLLCHGQIGTVYCDLTVNGRVHVRTSPRINVANLKENMEIISEKLRLHVLQKVQTYLSASGYDIPLIEELQLTHSEIYNVDIKVAGILPKNIKLELPPTANPFFEKDRGEDAKVFFVSAGKKMPFLMKTKNADFVLTNVKNVLFLEIFAVYLQAICIKTKTKEKSPELLAEATANLADADEVGADADEVGADEVGADEVGADEVGADEVGADEVYLPDAGENDLLQSSDIEDDDEQDGGGQPANYFIKRLIDYAMNHDKNYSQNPYWGTKDKNNKYTQANLTGLNIYSYPIPITREEQIKIDDRDNKNGLKTYYKSLNWNDTIYICPKYWSAFDNTTVHETQVGPAPKKYTKTVSAAKGVEDAADTVFAFGDSNARARDIKGYQPKIEKKQKNGKVITYAQPRCFVYNDKDNDEEVTQDVEETHQEFEEEAAPEQEDAAPEQQEETAPEQEQEKAQAEEYEEPTRRTILDFVQEFPCKKDKRFASLPRTISSFFGFRTYKDVVKANTSLVRSIRKDQNAFVECIAYLLNISLRSFKEQLEKIEFHEFLALQNGNVAQEWMQVEKVKINEQQAFKKFQVYLRDSPITSINYEYIWDYLHQPTNKIMQVGLNLLIIEMFATSVDTEFSFICHKNPYATNTYFDENKPFLLLLRSSREPTLYEPIVFVKAAAAAAAAAADSAFTIEKLFYVNSSSSVFNKKLREVSERLNDKCNPYSSVVPKNQKRALGSADILAIISEKLEVEKYNIFQIVGFAGKVIGIGLKEVKQRSSDKEKGKEKGTDRQLKLKIIPCYPSGILPVPETINILDIKPQSYKRVLDILQQAYALGIPCKPVANVVPNNPDNEKIMVIGILTECNDFLPVEPSVSLDNANEAVKKYNMLPTTESKVEPPLYTESALNYFLADKTIFTGTIARDSTTRADSKMLSDITDETANYNLFRRTVSYYLTRLENYENFLDLQRLLLQNAIPPIIDKLRTIAGPYLKFTDHMAAADNATKITLPKKNRLDAAIKNSIFYYAKIADELRRNRRTRDLILTNKIHGESTKKYTLNVNALEERLVVQDKSDLFNTYDLTQPLNTSAQDVIITYGGA